VQSRCPNHSAHWVQPVQRHLFVALAGFAILISAGCSSNKTQTINESYVQSVTRLSDGLTQHVDDVSRLARATTALQEADNLIREAAQRRVGAVANFSEINADYDATAEQLNSSISANQSANSGDVETLIELIATFQSALTNEELVELYPERAEFAAQTLMLLDGN
jgi:hypothetical protein